jgi:hypothetical protein
MDLVRRRCSLGRTMSWSLRWAASMVSAACSVMAGCRPVPSPRDDLPATIPVGEHLRFYTDEAEGAMCAGSLPYMDRYVGELIETHDVPPGHVVSYYWLPNDEELIEEVCLGSVACGFADATVVTPLLPHEHELVHAVRAHFGFSQDFLEEGAAELWGAHGDRDFDYRSSVEDGIELGVEDLPTTYYGTAGRFAAYMAFELGVEALVEIGKLTGPGSSPTEVDDAFEVVVGTTASEMARSYEGAGWFCGRSVYRDDSVSCAVAERMDCSLAADDGTLTIDFDLDCGSERFIGPRDGVFWSDLVISLESNRVVYLYLEANEADIANATFHRCDVGCEDPDDFHTLSPNVQYELIVLEGQHVVHLEVPDDGQLHGMATLAIRNVCPPSA